MQLILLTILRKSKLLIRVALQQQQQALLSPNKKKLALALTALASFVPMDVK